jgi:hypothetical protein
MVRGQLAALPGLSEAPAAGGEDHGPGLDDVLATAGSPAATCALELHQRRLRERGAGPRLEGLPERRGDREPRPIADLKQAFARCAAAACEPVAAVLARELDAELLEPVDRRRRLAGQELDEPPVGRLVRAPPDVRGVDLGRIIGAEGCLDTALSFCGVAGLERALRSQSHASACAFCRDRRGEPGGSRTDHEHVKGGRGAHPRDATTGQLIPLISAHYSSR